MVSEAFKRVSKSSRSLQVHFKGPQRIPEGFRDASKALSGVLGGCYGVSKGPRGFQRGFSGFQECFRWIQRVLGDLKGFSG